MDTTGIAIQMNGTIIPTTGHDLVERPWNHLEVGDVVVAYCDELRDGTISVPSWGVEVIGQIDENIAWFAGRHTGLVDVSSQRVWVVA
jgi:hypothetical protein